MSSSKDEEEAQSEMGSVEKDERTPEQIEADKAQDEIWEHNFTAEAYDIVDRERSTERMPRIEERKIVANGGIPPAPTGGWIWRPMKIVKKTVEGEGEDKTEFWDFEYTDAEKGKGSICATDNERFIAPLHSKSKEGAEVHPFKVDLPLDINDIFKSKRTGREVTRWRRAHVVAVAPYYVRITYDTWNAKFDEWLHVIEDGDRILPIGEMTERALRRRRKRNAAFKAKLEKELNLTVVEMAPDGNCLFRTIAHQVYGSAAMHKKVRSECCDYLSKNKDRFKGFESGSTFARYVKGMRTLSEWGGEPEINACEELYDRPVVIYDCDGEGDNIEPRQTHFKGDFPADDVMKDIEPIRLSFLDGNHYNSIVSLSLLGEMKDDCSFTPPELRKTSLIRDHRLRQMEDGEKEKQRIIAESRKKEKEEKKKKKKGASTATPSTENIVRPGEEMESKTFEPETTGTLKPTL